MNNSNPAFTSTKVDEMLMYFLQCTTPETKSHVTSVTLPCSTGAPFPNIFSPVVGPNGYLVPEDQPNTSGKNTNFIGSVFRIKLVQKFKKEIVSQITYMHYFVWSGHHAAFFYFLASKIKFLIIVVWWEALAWIEIYSP
jgi:hypothetical protein